MDREYIATPHILHYTHAHPRNTFKGAGAKPGGFQCAVNEESANNLFHYYATNGMITWASAEE